MPGSGRKGSRSPGAILGFASASGQPMSAPAPLAAATWQTVRGHLAELRTRANAGMVPADVFRLARSAPPPPKFIGDFAARIAFSASWRPPVNLEEVCSRLEVAFARTSMQSPKNLAEIYVVGDTPLIRVSVTLDAPIQRFVGAHALGHLLLLSELHPILNVTSLSGSSDESEANFFAASLLVPPVMLDSVFSSGTAPEIQALAGIFQVPPRIMELQLSAFLGHPTEW